jgi:hypothetical protein
VQQQLHIDLQLGWLADHGGSGSSAGVTAGAGNASAAGSSKRGTCQQYFTGIGLSTGTASASADAAPAAAAAHAPAGPESCSITGAADSVHEGCTTADDSSSSSTAHSAPPWCPHAYQEALQYAQAKNTAHVTSMYLASPGKAGSSIGAVSIYVWDYGHESIPSAAAAKGPAPSLRGLLLSCIKPGTDGSLQGYDPCPAFQQTYCKGWAQGPQMGRCVPGPEPLINSVLTDQALMSVLGLLEGRDIGRVLRVCRGWSKLLQGDAGFRARAQAHAEKLLRTRARMGYSSARAATRRAYDLCVSSSSDDEDGRYCYDDYDCGYGGHSDRSYGSF